MPVSKGIVDHALDLLALAGPVQARRMFGGYGLYVGGAMLGLLDDDELFLKTDDACRPEFVAAGCRQWIYPGAEGPVPGSYFRPPDDAHEDAESMLPWARLALGAARRALEARQVAAAARAARKVARAAKAADPPPRRKPDAKKPAKKSPARRTARASSPSGPGTGSPATRSPRWR